MSNVIELLERMGKDASLQTQQSFEKAIQESELTSELKQTLINRDDISLKRELDICPDVVCIFLPAEDEKPNEDSDEDEKTDNTN